jgi:diaminopimelate decarboxylase
MSLFERLGPEDIERALSNAVAAGHVPRMGGAVTFHNVDRLRERMGALRSAFPRALHAVAIKANPLVALLRQLVEGGAGLEAASLEEVHLGLAAGCSPDRLVFDSPAKSVRDLAEALALGIRINADNEDEIGRLDTLFGKGARPTAPIGLRVNPAVGEGTIGITSVAGRGARFGVPADASTLLGLFAARPWLTAVHVHVGSQGCPLALLVKAVQHVANVVSVLNSRLPTAQIRTLDIGGGLPARYRQADAPPSALDYAVALREAVPALFDGSVEVVTELGRSVHSGCGFTVSPVEYVKDVAETRVAVLHVGADLFLRTAYHPEDWPHEFLAFDADGHALDVTTIRPWTIAGPLCFAGDVIGRGVALPELRPGDLVVVRDTGAYTLGMWSRHCSRGMPLVLGYEGDGHDGFHVLRRRESPADIVAFWSLGAETGVDRGR